jgi:hypothetical protein
VYGRLPQQKYSSKRLDRPHSAITYLHVRMCRHISSRKGKCCEMASISRSIPFFCLEIPDAITNESLLQKDDNLGLRGCITHHGLFRLRPFFHLNVQSTIPFSRIPSFPTRIFRALAPFRGHICPKFAIKYALKQLFPARTSLYGTISLTLSIYDIRKQRKSRCFSLLSSQAFARVLFLFPWIVCPRRPRRLAIPYALRSFRVEKKKGAARSSRG